MRHTNFVTHSAAAIGAILALLAAAQVPATAQSSNATTQGSTEGRAPLRPDHPSITFGDGSHIDLHARVQHQITVRDDAGDEASDVTALDTAAFQRGRVGVSGTVASRVEFQVEHDVGRDGGADRWRDVFADVRVAKALRVRAGQFKVPFSREQLTSMYELDFTHRSAAVDELVPLRRVGVMAHGSLAHGLVQYQTGLFEQDRQTRLWVADAQRIVAGRATVAPLKDGRHLGSKALQLTAAWMREPLSEGRTGPDGRLISGGRYFEPVYARGRRTLLGGGAVVNVPRVTLAAETMRASYTRQGQAMDGGTLSDVNALGGYASAAWHVIGGKGRRRGTAPFRQVDVTGRYDWLAFDSTAASGEPSLSPRADRIAPLAKRTLTFGTTWHLNRWLALHTNAMRESLVDPSGSYAFTRTRLWSAVVRTQVVM